MKRNPGTCMIGPYDVLQILHKGKWMDYSTLRTASDFLAATRHMDRNPSAFRVQINGYENNSPRGICTNASKMRWVVKSNPPRKTTKRNPNMSLTSSSSEYVVTFISRVPGVTGFVLRAYNQLAAVRIAAEEASYGATFIFPLKVKVRASGARKGSRWSYFTVSRNGNITPSIKTGKRVKARRPVVKANPGESQLAYKVRVLDYPKRGDEPRPSYWLVDENDYMTKVSPAKWQHIKLEDRTSASVAEQIAGMRLRATRWKQFNKRVEDNSLARDWPTDKRHRMLCEYHNIAY
jgi:hypothetical protein